MRRRGQLPRITALLAVALLLGSHAGRAASPAEFTPTQKAHWAWKRPTRPPLPKAKDSSWVRNPIDAFILAKLEEKGLKPAPETDALTLLRRVTCDLTGLPPTLDEEEAFVRECATETGSGRASAKLSGRVGERGNGGSVAPILPLSSSPAPPRQPAAPLAYERLIDRLLASPAYGERWARHWLDLARYADTQGYEHDEVRAHAWRYRDYVVRSFNADKPYDRFIKEQLAGDELFPGDPDARIATGFNLLGPDMTDAADQAVRRQITLNDITDTAGLVFLGLTVGCARCHDHKYEPILQTDYYRLQSFFVGAQFRRDLVVATPAEQQAYRTRLQEWETRARAVQGELDALAGGTRSALREERVERLPEDVQTAFRLPERSRTADQQAVVIKYTPQVEPSAADVEARLPTDQRPRFRDLVAHFAELEKSRPEPLPLAMALDEPAEAPPTFVLGRGELSNRQQEVTPGFPIILAKGPAPAITPLTTGRGTGRRSALAEWIAGRDNPLAARVIVNRVWQHHFGRGIVPTPSDFGVRGEDATHRELLDWLACAFTTRATSHGVDSGTAGQRDSGNRAGSTTEAPRDREKGDRTIPPSRPLALPPSSTKDVPASVDQCGWSLKKLHRLILTSSAYRQSSLVPAATLKSDPDNALFSRVNRQRLEAEVIRDASLAVAGRLNRKMGGPGVFPPIPPEARPPNATAWPVTRDPAEYTRRSLYIFVRRNLHFPLLEAFDAPDTNQSCPRREQSTAAPQALALLNAPEMLENAAAFAARVRQGAAARDERIALAYRLALGRPPSPAEAQLAVEFLERQPKLIRTASGSGETEAWTDFCLALLNVNEFVYVD
jgi:hypothetical protein